MNDNLQQKLIAEYLWEEIDTDQNNPFDDFNELYQYVCKNMRRLSSTDIIAIDLVDNWKPIKVVDGFEDLSTISKDAVMISFKKMENKFYEEVTRELY